MKKQAQVMPKADKAGRRKANERRVSFSGMGKL
jgi:hypothetical protein